MLIVRSFVLMALLFAGGVANADVIMTVDVSDPTAVVFSPTAAFASTTFLNASGSIQGTTLLGFFSANTGELFEFLDSGGINVFDTTAGTTRGVLDSIFVGDFTGGWTPLDLNFHQESDAFVTSFLSTETALTGLASHDLSALTGLPAIGTGGIVLVDSPNSNKVIGEWGIVPEPSTAVLTALGLIGLAARRRRS